MFLVGLDGSTSSTRILRKKMAAFYEWSRVRINVNKWEKTFKLKQHFIIEIIIWKNMQNEKLYWNENTKIEEIDVKLELSIKHK